MTQNSNNAMQLFLAGLGTGVALTLLLAPMSGPAARKLIAGKVKDGAYWVNDQADAAESYVVAQGTALRDRVKEAADVLVKA